MNSEEFNALKVTSVTVTWVVENIWQLSFDGISSSAFMLSDHIFHLYMRRYELSIAVYLCRDDPIPNVMPLLCKLCMLDHIGQEELIVEREIVMENEKGFILLESVMVDALEKQKEVFLTKDTFTISCTLSSSYRLSILRKEKPEAQQTVNRFETLSSDLENFYRAQTKSDVVLKVEGTEFPVHRAILCARCPELASKLEEEESADGVVHISNVPATIMQDILHYVYSGKIQPVNSANCLQMLDAANRFSLSEIREVCLNFLRINLTEDNVFEAATLACEYGDLFLKEEVDQFFTKHMSTILQGERWKEFSSGKYKFANEILTAILLRMQPTTSENNDC